MIIVAAVLSFLPLTNYHYHPIDYFPILVVKSFVVLQDALKHYSLSVSLLQLLDAMRQNAKIQDRVEDQLNWRPALQMTHSNEFSYS